MTSCFSLFFKTASEPNSAFYLNKCSTIGSDSGTADSCFKLSPCFRVSLLSCYILLNFIVYFMTRFFLLLKLDSQDLILRSLTDSLGDFIVACSSLPNFCARVCSSSAVLRFGPCCWTCQESPTCLHIVNAWLSGTALLREIESSPVRLRLSTSFI